MTSHRLLTLSAPFAVGMVWAQARGGVIGADGTLPWHIPEDLVHFKSVTEGYAVLHGRKSYEALPKRFRPLPGRRNLVLTTDHDYRAPGAEVVHSIAEARTLLGSEPLWIAGGGQVYSSAMRLADVLVVSEIDMTVTGSTFAPEVDGDIWHPVQQTAWVTSERGPRFRVKEYRRQ